MVAAFAVHLTGCGSWGDWFNGGSTTGQGANAPVAVAEASRPVVVAVTPSFGVATVQSDVVVSGVKFLADDTVSFEKKDTAGKTLTVTLSGATFATDANGTKFTGRSPLFPEAGKWDVVIARGGTEQARLLASYTISSTAGRPIITGVFPSSGLESGSTTVVITGTDLDASVTVTLGDAPLLNIAAVTSKVGVTFLTGQTQKHVAGKVNVTVSNPNGSDSLPNGYEYTASPAAVAPAPVAPVVTGSVAFVVSTSTVTAGANLALTFWVAGTTDAGSDVTEITGASKVFGVLASGSKTELGVIPDPKLDATVTYTITLTPAMVAVEWTYFVTKGGSPVTMQPRRINKPSTGSKRLVDITLSP